MSFREWVIRVLDIKPEVREVVKYQVVEVPNLRTQSGWNREMRETVTTLSAHPGFVALCDRLALQAANLKQKLNYERHANIRDVEFLQSGIFWCNWLKQQVDAATNRVAIAKRDAEMEDVEAIKQIEATYNFIGNEQV